MHLQEIPSRILRALIENPGSLVPRERIVEEIWPGEDLAHQEHSLNAAVNKLRAALSDLADHPRYIETIPRRGYRYIGPTIEFGSNNGHQSAEGPAAPEPPAPGSQSIPPHEAPHLCFEDFQMDLETGELTRGGIAQPLAPQPAKVLALLAGRAGQLVTRESIRQEVWGNDTFVDFEQGLNNCIKAIRKALDDDPDAPRYIQTVPRRGYRFLAPVERISSAETVVAIADSPPDPIPEAAARRRPTLSRAWRWAMGIAALLLIAVVMIALMRGTISLTRLMPDAAIPHIASIAVLPLENLSNDPEQEFFADGMTEELITTLGRVGSLRVISRTSVMRYKRTQKPVPEIARELNVDAVIEGTVQQVDGRVRVTANLLHGPTDRHLWAERYEQDLDDVLVLQRDIARAVARQVRASVSPAEQEQLALSRPVNHDAHEQYLKGQFHYYMWRAPEFQKALTYYQRAIDIDPDYAEAHLGLARTYGWLWIVGALPPREAYPKFTAALKRGTEIDDGLAEGHYVKAVAAWYFFWNWAEAEAAFKKALELNPNHEEARFEYAWFLSTMGRQDEAIPHAERAVAGDPLSAPANLALGDVYSLAGRFDSALATLQRAAELGPNDPRVYEFLRATYNALGLYDEVVRIEQKAMMMRGAKPEDIEALGNAYRTGGRAGYLQWQLARARHPFQKARLQAHLGMHDEAMANLEECYRQHWWAMVRLYTNREWDPIRNDPRFQELLRRMKFPGAG
ncbi:MAG: winged helix-turn-helix domain-containing protein [Bryobacterales bacterium]|nr:winged helix-turn-helix domain-containing protein [Bryobacterales bacterium]